MSIYTSIGAATGLMIGLIVCIILFRYANTNKKAKTEYDERQQTIRFRAYRYAFYSMLVYELIMMILAMDGLELPLAGYAQHFLGIMIGCIVLCIYCIWNDVYWGLNNNKMKYTIVFIVAFLLNLIPIAGSIAKGTLVEDGRIGMPVLNIMVVVMMVIITGTLLIKHIVDRTDKNEED